MSTITDEELAAELKNAHARYFAGVEVDEWSEVGPAVAGWYLAEARTARRLLCPPTAEELRIERGRAAYETFYGSRDWDHCEISGASHRAWCRVADAVLDKAREQEER